MICRRLFQDIDQKMLPSDNVRTQLTYSTLPTANPDDGLVSKDARNSREDFRPFHLITGEDSHFESIKWGPNHILVMVRIEKVLTKLSSC
jgi:hypothetical protein